MDEAEKTVTPKTLSQMTAEIVENNTAKGWYEHCATFPEAMALLHSEVSEALEAWRKWGLRDVTVGKFEQDELDGILPKPEGVGSEFADIFIRLLDDCYLFGQIDLESAVIPGWFCIDDLFVANINALHLKISSAYMAWEASSDYGYWFGSILTFLRQLCEAYGIDLLAEYERKMQFNRSRPYRHGNKRI